MPRCSLAGVDRQAVGSIAGDVLSARGVSPRHLAYAIGGALVLGLGLYLYVQVRATAVEAAAPVISPRPVSPPTPVAKAPDDVAPPVAVDRPRPDAAVGSGAAPPPPVAPTLPPTGDGTLVVERDFSPRLDSTMSEANKAYDRGDFDDASVAAAKVLAKDPTNVRMLRVMVSSACINGDTAVAQKYYAPLPEPDRAQMRIRCERYGVTFEGAKPAGSP
jgi:hypothetical protein